MKKRGKVLVVEDNIPWREDLTNCLLNAGFYVDVAQNLETAIQKVTKENFHFITIDMELVEGTNRDNFQGWKLLEVIKKLRLQRTTPVMVVTGFEQDYLELKVGKNIDALFFMGKGDFDDKKFVEVITNTIKTLNIHFNDGYR